MRRAIFESLKAWRHSQNRKPLVLVGARQVGKTTVLQDFGTTFEKCHYFDLERNKATIEPIFSSDIDPVKIVRDLSLLKGQSIGAQDLIVLDEIQAIPRAITSLKYFQQEMPNQAVAAAGSHLGVAAHGEGFPVGKVTILQMYPMTFLEFLQAMGQDLLVDSLTAVTSEMSMTVALHELSMDYLKYYMVTGGMPEIVANFVNEFDPRKLPDIFDLTRTMQSSLVDQLCRDFGKYADQSPARKIEVVFRSIPAHLGRNIDGNSQRFQFKSLRYDNKRIRRYEDMADPLEWLRQSGLAYKIHIVESIETPISSQFKPSIFKLFLHDIGLLGAMSNLSPTELFRFDFGTWKGFFVENYVLQELIASGIGEQLACWKGKSSEVEFVCSSQGCGLIPLEVKAATNTKAKSLNVYASKYQPHHVVRVTGKRFGFNFEQKSVTFPLTLVGFIKSADFGVSFFQK